MIWQIDKQSGYDGDSIMTELWHNVKYENKFIRNLHPVKGGTGPYGDEIYFENNNTQKNNLESGFSSSISSFEDQINKCHKCDLGNSRTNFVFGVGDENASLMLVGEAPGEKEDLEGEPFVGRAGKLLDKMLISINLGF